MTSKNLFFNIMKEDFKGKMGALLMNCFVMLICFPIIITLQLQNITQRVTENISTREEAVGELRYYISGENEIVMLVAVCFAVVIAFIQFSYLYQKSQVDFYHSLPVSRTKYFFARFINGILVFAIPYILFTMIGVGIISASQFGNIDVVKTAALGIVVHMIGFILCYATTILAICMTGNVLTGILGTLVFHGYGLALAGIVEALMSRYSDCYMSAYDPFAKISCQLTPVWMYVELGYRTGSSSWNSTFLESANGASIIKWLLYCVAVIVIMTALAFIAFQKRKSESAGKSMAFVKTKSVIKVCIMVLAVCFITMMFWSMAQEAIVIWEIVGFILGLVISHILIQVIYEMDIRAILKGMPSTITAVVLSVVVLLGFQVGGNAYDQWEADWEKIESIAVNPGEIYGYYTQPSLYNLETGRYQDRETLIYENMKFQDKELAEEFVKACIQDRETAGTKWNIRIQFTFKNGKNTYRHYSVRSEVISEYMPKLMEKQEFRKGINSVFWIDEDDVDVIRYYTEEGNGYNEQSLGMNKEEIKSFIETYKEEYEKAPISQINDQAPVYALELYNHENDTVLTEMYVYPAFEKTMDILQKAGLKKDPYEGCSIRSIEISKCIRNVNEEYQKVTYTETEKLEALSQILAYGNMGYYTNFDGDYNVRNQYSIWVQLEDKDGKIIENNAVFIDEIPEWVNQDLEKSEIDTVE